MTGLETIYAVIGGTHLISASAKQLDLTISELLSLGIQRLGVSHCTGLAASAVLAQRFGETFLFINAGICVDL